MIVCTTWKARPLTPEQSNRMMAIWGKLEASMAENPAVERLCWYLNVDGSGGITVAKTDDTEAASALGLEQSLALGEFLEFDTKTVLDLESAMGPITKAMEHING